MLKLFYEELISEWESAGNQASEFAGKGAKIVIVLDNASFHKKEEYLKKIGFFLTWYAKLTIKMPSKQTSIFVIFKIPKAICRRFY